MSGTNSDLSLIPPPPPPSPPPTSPYSPSDTPSTRARKGQIALPTLLQQQPNNNWQLAILHNGYLTKLATVSNRNWKLRYGVLTGLAFSYYETEESFQRQESPKGIIEIQSDGQIETEDTLPVSGFGLRYTSVNLSHPLVIAFTTIEDRLEWIHAFRLACNYARQALRESSLTYRKLSTFSGKEMKIFLQVLGRQPLNKTKKVFLLSQEGISILQEMKMIHKVETLFPISAQTEIHIETSDRWIALWNPWQREREAELQGLSLHFSSMSTSAANKAFDLWKGKLLAWTADMRRCNDGVSGQKSRPNSPAQLSPTLSVKKDMSALEVSALRKSWRKQHSIRGRIEMKEEGEPPPAPPTPSTENHSTFDDGFDDLCNNDEDVKDKQEKVYPSQNSLIKEGKGDKQPPTPSTSKSAPAHNITSATNAAKKKAMLARYREEQRRSFTVQPSEPLSLEKPLNSSEQVAKKTLAEERHDIVEDDGDKRKVTGSSVAPVLAVVQEVKESEEVVAKTVSTIGVAYNTTDPKPNVTQSVMPNKTNAISRNSLLAMKYMKQKKQTVEHRHSQEGEIQQSEQLTGNEQVVEEHTKKGTVLGQPEVQTPSNGAQAQLQVPVQSRLEPDLSNSATDHAHQHENPSDLVPNSSMQSSCPVTVPDLIVNMRTSNDYSKGRQNVSTPNALQMAALRKIRRQSLMTSPATVKAVLKESNNVVDSSGYGNTVKAADTLLPHAPSLSLTNSDANRSSGSNRQITATEIYEISESNSQNSEPQNQSIPHEESVAEKSVVTSDSSGRNSPVSSSSKEEHGEAFLNEREEEVLSPPSTIIAAALPTPPRALQRANSSSSLSTSYPPLQSKSRSLSEDSLQTIPLWEVFDRVQAKPLVRIFFERFSHLPSYAFRRDSLSSDYVMDANALQQMSYELGRYITTEEALQTVRLYGTCPPTTTSNLGIAASSSSMRGIALSYENFLVYWRSHPLFSTLRLNDAIGRRRVVVAAMFQSIDQLQQGYIKQHSFSSLLQDLLAKGCIKLTGTNVLSSSSSHTAQQKLYNHLLQTLDSQNTGKIHLNSLVAYLDREVPIYSTKPSKLNQLWQRLRRSSSLISNKSRSRSSSFGSVSAVPPPPSPSFGISRGSMFSVSDNYHYPEDQYVEEDSDNAKEISDTRMESKQSEVEVEDLTCENEQEQQRELEQAQLLVQEQERLQPKMEDVAVETEQEALSFLSRSGIAGVQSGPNHYVEQQEIALEYEEYPATANKRLEASHLSSSPTPKSSDEKKTELPVVRPPKSRSRFSRNLRKDTRSVEPMTNIKSAVHQQEKEESINKLETAPPSLYIGKDESIVKSAVTAMSPTKAPLSAAISSVELATTTAATTATTTVVAGGGAVTNPLLNRKRSSGSQSANLQRTPSDQIPQSRYSRDEPAAVNPLAAPRSLPPSSLPQVPSSPLEAPNTQLYDNLDHRRHNLSINCYDDDEFLPANEKNLQGRNITEKEEEEDDDAISVVSSDFRPIQRLRRPATPLLSPTAPIETTVAEEATWPSLRTFLTASYGLRQAVSQRLEETLHHHYHPCFELDQSTKERLQLLEEQLAALSSSASTNTLTSSSATVIDSYQNILEARAEVEVLLEELSRSWESMYKSNCRRERRTLKKIYCILSAHCDCAQQDHLHMEILVDAFVREKEEGEKRRQHWESLWLQAAMEEKALEEEGLCELASLAISIREMQAQTERLHREIVRGTERNHLNLIDCEELALEKVEISTCWPHQQEVNVSYGDIYEEEYIPIMQGNGQQLWDNPPVDWAYIPPPPPEPPGESAYQSQIEMVDLSHDDEYGDFLDYLDGDENEEQNDVTGRTSLLPVSVPQPPPLPPALESPPPPRKGLDMIFQAMMEEKELYDLYGDDQ